MNEEILQSFQTDKKNHYRPETIRRYFTALNQFFEYRPKNYTEIQRNNVRGWLAYMRNRGYSDSTIQMKLTALKSFYKYCIEKNKLQSNPTQTIRVYKQEEFAPYYLSEHEIKFLQKLTEDNLMDRAIFETLYTTGVRVDELIQMQLKDMQLVKQHLWIPKGKRNKERYVALSTDCIKSIVAYLKQREIESPYLFCQLNGEPLTSESMNLLFVRFSLKLKIKITPFTLRYTYAAFFTKKGIPVENIQEQLGYVNKSSGKIYTRIMNDARKN